MKKTLLLLAIFTLFNFPRSNAVTNCDSLNIAPFGKVFIYKGNHTPQNAVILISGDAGWKYGVIDFAVNFSKDDNLVIGIDIVRYYKELRKRSSDCYNVSADFVQLAVEIEKRYKFPEYKPAFIMGYSSGATLVYGILAQSRPRTFAGGISLGFCPEVDLPKMFCETNGLSETVIVSGKSYFLRPDAVLGNRWIVLHGLLDDICTYSETADFVSKTRDAELITLPNVGHGFSQWKDFMPQWHSAFQKLKTEFELSLQDTAGMNDFKNIPAIVTNTESRNDKGAIALIISGDGGWYSFEQKIADNFVSEGIPSLGLDSRKYFWNRKTPVETAGDIAKMLGYYMSKWGKNRFILVGYSLGAEIVPFVVNNLPYQIRSELESVVLLSPDNTTDFEIHISNMVGMGNRQNTYNVVNEIVKMPETNTLIIYGDGEKTDVPALLSGSAVKIRKIPGDHHYKFDLPLIMKTMKENGVF
jgi:type IV secretory pathway VirJ component